ncbi:MAG: class I SAM-dependent methyltransferase [Lachnospiraceae bacterium]|nr:class I SAM-dependent methyltransferase [Lachnospiraceae bacterium]
MKDTKDVTLAYYAENAEAFAQGTVSADMQAKREEFLREIPAGGRILDFGCGSGRDAKAFLEMGYAVDASDGSEELCEYARAYTGIDVRCSRFEELCAQEAYDGIWACSSILHLPREELRKVMERIRDALVPGGVLYSSFRFGLYEGMRGGRYYTDFTEMSFREFLEEIPGLEEIRMWMTNDVRPGRQDDLWLNILLKRRQKA